jgi:uncharacterized protein YjbI with pentapeptide repeats
MPRKPALLLHLLNLVLKPIAGQTSAPSNQLVALPQHPLAHDRETWRAHWKAQGQPWRTEPEIAMKRQEYLAERRTIKPNIEKGIYPFRGVKLSRADVEWLLTTHENGRGPVDWSDESQRGRTGLDLRGGELQAVDLSRLPLARLRGGVTLQERHQTISQKRRMADIHLERANLFQAHLEGSFLRGACLNCANLALTHLENADCVGTHMEGADLEKTHLDGAYLRRTYFDRSTFLKDVSLGNEKTGFISMVDVHWGDAILATVQWQQLKMLGNERRARQPRTEEGKIKDKSIQLLEYEDAVRANLQLAIMLQNQGLNEDAARFAYRAQSLQKYYFRLQMLQSGARFRQRIQSLGAWLFSCFLFLIAGYGYRLWRSFLAYALVIIGFTTAYYLLGASFKPSLSLVNALGLSMTSFHGRGFFPGVTQLNDTLTILASVEAFVGLILEATFIATLTRRFFGK